MTDLPEPLTPADCDLRDFQFMPMDIVRLFGSRFHAIANDAEWRAGITLWLKSFHQVPSASIPDDEVELARLAEFGRDLKSFRKVRVNALHGWVKCSDGRLYHPVVAEKALEAYKKKEFYRERSKKANAKRWGGLDNKAEYEGHEGEREDGESGSRRNDQGQPQAFHEASLKHPSRNPSASQGTVKGHIAFTNVNGDGGENRVEDHTLQADPKKALWDALLAYLGAKHRAKIAQWIRDYGEPAVDAALKAAKAENFGEGAAEPVPFMQVVLRNGAEREAKRLEAERLAELEFDRRHPPRVLSRSDARALMTDAEFARWEARQASGSAVA